jgi:uncharacterized protein YggE
MMKKIVFTLLLSISLSISAESLPTEPHIVVTGNYKTKVVPDTLHMSLSIIETGKEVAPVSQRVESRSAKLISSLKALGINKKDINSSALRITPHYNWRNKEQVYVGTEVSRNIEITLRKLALYDRLIRTMLDIRVGRINSSRLQSSKESEIRKQAMQRAVDDARIKAELLLSNITEKLGSVFSISHLTAAQIQPRSRMSYQASNVAETAFEPGVIEFNESVKVIYYLTR